MTSRLIPLIASVSMLFCSAAQAQFLSKETPAGDSILEFNKRMPRKNTEISNAVRSAETLGWNIFRYESLRDAASYALATEAGSMETSGAIVVPGEQWRVRFYKDEANGTISPVADVLFDNALNTTMVPQGATSPFSATEEAMIQAEKLVNMTQPMPCEGEYTTVVMPAPAGQSGFYVYVIRKSLDFKRLPEGQHLLVEVSEDGSSIVKTREFSSRCNMPSIGIGSGAEARPQFRLSHSMDHQPTELHIYLSLRYNLELFIATMPSNLYWTINNGVVEVDD